MLSWQLRLASRRLLTNGRMGVRRQRLIRATSHPTNIARPLSLTTQDWGLIVKCPAFAESISEGDIAFQKEVGDSVDADELVAEVETDKTAVEVNAPHGGVITKLLVADGDTVTPGTPLFEIEEGGGGGAKPAPTPVATKAEPAAPASTAAPIPTQAPKPDPVPTAPLSTQPTGTVKPTVMATPAAAAAPAMSGNRVERRVKMNRMRIRIGQRLKQAQNTAAMLTTFNEVDMKNIMEMRKKYKDVFEKEHNARLSFMSAFIKASCLALEAEPAVNGVIDDATNEIIYRDYVDISFAAATPKGLVVPVIRNVDSMSFLDIEREMSRLAGLARNGQLAVEDMDGGTFTISNGGVFGSLFGTPIINPPQSAILGMHGVFDRPVAINGQVEIRPMMYIALTYDHRLVDGREAVTTLRRIKEKVEDPYRFLLNL